MTDSRPGGDRAGHGLIYSLASFALVVVILWGVISGEAFPLLNSNATAAAICWVCPVGLLAGMASLMGVFAGFVALSELKAKRPSEAYGKAWSAVAFGGVSLTALFAFVIYFLNRGLMQ